MGYTIILLVFDVRLPIYVFLNIERIFTSFGGARSSTYSNKMLSTRVGLGRRLTNLSMVHLFKNKNRINIFIKNASERSNFVKTQVIQIVFMMLYYVSRVKTSGNVLNPSL